MTALCSLFIMRRYIVDYHFKGPESLIFDEKVVVTACERALCLRICLSCFLWFEVGEARLMTSEESDDNFGVVASCCKFTVDQILSSFI